MTEHKTAAEPKEPKQAQKVAHDSIGALSVDPNQLIELVAKELQGIPEIKPPAWSVFVKTGAYKERPPVRKDWWHIRAAAVLRTVARIGPVGTSKLRTRFGGKHSRGHKSERFAPGSGSIIRKILQQLEKAGLIKQAAKGVHKGRVITKKSLTMIETAAQKVAKDYNRVTARAAVVKAGPDAHSLDIQQASQAATAAKEHAKA